MKVNELTIGNLIQDFDCEPFYFAIESIYKNEIGVYRASYRSGSIHAVIEDIEPIPITEEWLDKFDLMKLDNERYRTFSNYLIKNINGKWFWSYISYPDNVHLLAEIKYVHQLQNKVFINTNQELKFKDVR